MGTISLSLPSDGATIDAADVNTPFNTIAAAINGNLDNDNIASGANISGTKLLAGSIPGTAFDTNAAGGWITTTIAAPNTITNNGNRNYSLVFNSVDYTQEISNGMRLRFTRTVTAPTQCTDLEAGSSQYFSKTTPAGLTFTDDFTVGAWIKLESYTAGGIIARRNVNTEGWSFGVLATGQISVGAFRIASNNSEITSYPSIPLNKWVHVAASVDLSGTSVLMYIDGVLVSSLTTITGTITALVQGTTALVVGALKSAGTDPFDGKIAQAFVNSTVLSAATIRTLSSQTLTGAETGMAAAYSLSNSLLDLTANDNDLTAVNSALATNVDSPFAGGASASTAYTAGTTEYGEVYGNPTFSTNTTVVVQVPDGYAIPTSGGVSAVAYSVADRPLGFVNWDYRVGNTLIQTNQTTITTITDLLGATTTFTANGINQYKFTFDLMLQTAGAGGSTTISLLRDGVVIYTRLLLTPTAAANTTLASSFTEKPTAGAHTYKLQVTNNLGTNTSTSGSATGPIQFLAEMLP